MRVRCRTNLGKYLPEDLIDKVGGYTKDARFEALTIGKEYNVYAIAVLHGYLWFYLSHDYNLDYPVHKPVVLFDIVDPRVSQYWEIGFHLDKETGRKDQIIAYKEWVREPYYYGGLLEGEEREVKIYKHYKSLMDKEFQS